MSWFARYVRSSIGAKHVMAVTGLLLLVFAIVHMLGHLQVFGGQEMYDHYATFLQDLWEVKWPVRVGLLALLILHVVLALMLVAKNRAARPAHYAVYRPVVSTVIGRTMAISGTVVLAFLIFHIWHFTIGPTHTGHTYAMYVHAFQQPLVYGAYLVGIALLSAHLGHGASSWLQSLGWRHPKYPTDKLGPIVAVSLFVGYMLPPTAVLIGAVS
ncbi:MAG TPA: succinate dehydrogenase cytochrome b subunit [Kofleriaceae bacterium]